jgi:hypothetical protein
MAVPGFRVRPSDRPLTETKDFALTGIDRHRQAEVELAAKVTLQLLELLYLYISTLYTIGVAQRRAQCNIICGIFQVHTALLRFNSSVFGVCMLFHKFCASMLQG